MPAAKKSSKKTKTTTTRKAEPPKTTTTAAVAKIPASLRGLDVTTPNLPQTIPSTERLTGFVPMSGHPEPGTRAGASMPVFTGVVGHGPLELNPFGPYGSYINAGERPSTATALTPTGERWSSSSPQWIETASGPVNIDPYLAKTRNPGIATPQSSGSVSTAQPQQGVQETVVNPYVTPTEATTPAALNQASQRRVDDQQYEPPQFASFNPVDFGSYLSYARARRRGLA